MRRNQAAAASGGEASQWLALMRAIAWLALAAGLVFSLGFGHALAEEPMAHLTTPDPAIEGQQNEAAGADLYTPGF